MVRHSRVQQEVWCSRGRWARPRVHVWSHVPTILILLEGTMPCPRNRVHSELLDSRIEGEEERKAITISRCYHAHFQFSGASRSSTYHPKFTTTIDGVRSTDGTRRERAWFDENCPLVTWVASLLKEAVTSWAVLSTVHTNYCPSTVLILEPCVNRSI